VERKLNEFGETVWVPRERAASAHQVEVVREPEARGPSVNPHQMAARGFGQSFGLHPAVSFFTVAVDVMVQAAVVGSDGLLLPLSIVSGVVVAVVTYRAQQHWYGDDKESAAIKAAIVGLLTAIPSPLPYMLFVPAGVVGWFHRLRAKKGK
jgi:hypothetical protein